jgi:hypothetical protein
MVCAMSYTIFDGTQKWPFARVPFEVDELSFPLGSPERNNIDAAVRAWNTGSAVVRIVPRDNQPDYVRFIPDEVKTASQVGRKGGPQDVNAAYFPAIPAAGSIAAINQLVGQIDCLYFDAAGALRVSWVVGTGTWTGPNALTGPGVGQPGQPLATARQLDNQIDIFFIDGNGVVNVMWVLDGGAWQGPVGLTPPATAVPGSPLATARQLDNQIDIFFIDGNGGLNVMWVLDGGAWQGPVAFLPNQFAAGSLIHELGHAIGLFHEHQRPDSGAFVTIVGGGPPNYGPMAGAAPVGPYDCGSIMHYGPSNNPPTLSVISPAKCTNVGQRVGPSNEDLAAVDYLYGRVSTAGASIVSNDQTTGQLDVFVADRFGSVAVKWVQDVNVWQGAVEISAPGSVRPGQPLATARQLDNQIDIFFIDGNGVVNVMWVLDGGAWQGPVGLTPPATAVPGSPLATARQLDNQIDIFFIDGNGVVNVMWVLDGGAWQGPVGL